MNQVTILNKIKNKHILIEKIFSFVTNRPMIFQYLLDKDPILKLSIKNSYKSLKKSNQYSKDINKLFNKFIITRRMYEKDYTPYLTDIDFLIPFFSTGLDDLHNYINIFSYIFNNYTINDEISSFIYDYFKIHKEIYLTYPPNNESNMIMNMYFLSNIKDTNNNSKMKTNLICKINDSLEILENEETIFDDYFEINNIYLYSSNKKVNLKSNYIDNIYISLRKLRNLNLKEKGKNIIILDKYFHLPIFISDYSKKRKEKNFDLHLDYIEKIIFDEEYYYFYTRFFVRYNLSFLFNNAWCKIIIIKSSDLNNIKTMDKKIMMQKLNMFESHEETDLKILLIDFEHNSPYQENFIFFCNNYLRVNDTIDTIAIFNIGKKNYDSKCYDKMKNQNPEMYFSKLVNIIYENNDDNYESNENDVKEFINLFFYTDNLFYYVEIYNNNSNQLRFLFFVNEVDIKDIIVNVINKFCNSEYIMQIYYDNINLTFYNDAKMLSIKKEKNVSLNSVNYQKILGLLKKMDKVLKVNYFYGDKNVIQEFNKMGMDYNSKILTEKSQFNIIIKGIQNIGIAVVRRKFLNSKSYYEVKDQINSKNPTLMIFKTSQGIIFGLYINIKGSFVFKIGDDKIIYFQKGDLSFNPVSRTLKIKNCFGIYFHHYGEGMEVTFFGKMIDDSIEKDNIILVEVFPVKPLIHIQY